MIYISATVIILLLVVLYMYYVKRQIFKRMKAMEDKIVDIYRHVEWADNT